jgi:hypothetical protein
MIQEESSKHGNLFQTANPLMGMNYIPRWGHTGE